MFVNITYPLSIKIESDTIGRNNSDATETKTVFAMTFHVTTIGIKVRS